MTTLVTGGAGYIGSHTVRALRDAGREVVVLDNLERGNSAHVLDAKLIVGDTSDAELIEDICRKYGIANVIHFAAYKAVGESMIFPKKYWQNNVQSTISLLSSLMKHNVNRVVFSSTAGVYGTPKESPVSESIPAAPLSVYAATKLAVETILGSLQGLGMKAVSLRYFNAAGASSDNRIGEDWLKSENLIPRVMRALLDKDFEFTVFGNDYPTPDKTCIRDYIHVEDLAVAHLKALEYLEAGGNTMVCNVGTGYGTSVLEVIEQTEKIVGRNVPLKFGARRAGDPISVFADPSLAQKVFNWKATRNLEQIIATAWNWHRSSS